MVDDNLRGDISRLEARIEQLAERIEHCRKIMLVARGVIVAGLVLLVAMAIGLVRFDGLPILALALPSPWWHRHARFEPQHPRRGGGRLAGR